ncbi:hypothetical protein THTE_2327 [Thermogutta terrifontis]|uniref:Uncharacterized protein n=1 Tax=Thermogutta terrifontis TaxID=1331910 RepID=A0A286RG36_9BACT|nr:hypothetical protein THTE_2327 [Thermogutta terrifontis]
MLAEITASTSSSPTRLSHHPRILRCIVSRSILPAPPPSETVRP